MADFKYFRHAITGKVGSYPEDFADLFPDTFIEVDSNAADCIDCRAKPDEDEVLDEDFEVEFLGITEDDDLPDPVVARSDDKKKDK